MFRPAGDAGWARTGVRAHCYANAGIAPLFSNFSTSAPRALSRVGRFRIVLYFVAVLLALEQLQKFRTH